MLLKLRVGQALVFLLAALPFAAQGQPSVPQNLAATQGDGTVTLTWADPSDATITGYSYRYATSESTFTGSTPPAWTAIAGSGATTTDVIVPNLTNGLRYHFQLRAANGDGDGAAAQTTLQLIASPSAAVTINDVAVRSRLEASLGKEVGAVITRLEMTKLTSFHATNAGVTDLTGLEHAINLTILHLEDNAISDISALGSLTSLEDLWLENNAISDISPLGTLTSLSLLYMDGNRVSDVSPLGTLTSLRYLYLGDNALSDVSALGSLTSLRHLHLHANSISDVSALGTLTSLVRLYLGGNSISDVSALASLTSLKQLGLNGNSISDISALETLTSLYQLALNDNSVSDISALSALNSMQFLGLKNNSVSDVSALQSHTQMVALNLSSNTISNISALANLTGMEALLLNNNQISDISPLATCTGLENLSLGWNSISDISVLANFQRLDTLRLNNNSISDISALSSLPSWSLSILHLDGNSISDVSALGSMRLLRTLTLANNTVSNISSLLSIGPLAEVSLDGNPLGARAIDVHIPELKRKGVRVSFNYSPVPTDFTASVLGDGTGAVLRWTSAAVSRYQLRWGASVDFLIGRADISGTATSHQVNGLANGISYVFELRGLDSDGQPGPVARAHATMAARPSAAVQFQDSVLAAGVAAALGKAAGETLNEGELATITELDVSAGGPAPSSSPSFAPKAARKRSGGGAVTDLSGVERLVNLRRLNLDHNAVNSLAPLLELNHLEWLSVRGQALTSDSAFVHIPALVDRGVEVLFDEPVAADLGDVALAEGMARALGKPAGALLTEADLLLVRELNIGGAGVRDLSGIEKVVKLERLTASGNQLRSLAPLTALPALEWLDLSDNGLTDVSDLSGLTGLRTLFLGGNALSDVSALASLTRLRALTLSDNQVRDLSALSGLVALEELWLAGNGLADLRPLRSLASLRHLHLGGNRVADVSPLGGLRELRKLWLNDNELTSLAPLRGLRSLAWLDAARNRIATVQLRMAALTRLRLDDNRIADLAALAGHTGLGEGDMVGLRRNPLSATAIEVHLPELRGRGVAVSAGHALPLFPAADDPSGRVGFVRVLNRTNAAGEVLVSAVDDSGVRWGPVRLALGAGAAAHFNSWDLQSGNAAKGLPQGLGASTTAGDLRLELLSALDIDALAYIRTPDGFLTSVHDMLPRTLDSRALRAATFNPGRNRAQRSQLRLTNPGGVDDPVSVWGVDDVGSGRLARGLVVPAGATRTVDATGLERSRHEGIMGLGRGTGKWRLAVNARWPVEGANLLVSPTGHVANLSTAPKADASGVWRVPLFPAAHGAAKRHGFVRVVNHSRRPGEVRVLATDDGARRVETTVALDAAETVHLNSADLERGNAAKGMSVGVGAPTRGDWRLSLASDLDIEVASFVRHDDGFLTSMHDLAPWSEANSAAQVVFFNPGSNFRQESLLRLFNDGDARAQVAIAGVDDAGEAGGMVRVSVPAGEALTLSAAELEAGGPAFQGALGDGDGKWRLTVTSDEPIGVMSLLEGAAGHLTNLSSGGS